MYTTKVVVVYSPTFLVEAYTFSPVMRNTRYWIPFGNCVYSYVSYKLELLRNYCLQLLTV